MSSGKDTGSDRQSRRELLETIESQKDQIARYESRLRDVVRAYKGVVKEKDALESSLAILNESKSEKSGGEDVEGGEEEKSENDEGEDEKKVKKLTASLTTLTAEKSRLEVAFQEDRKKIRGELAEKEKCLESTKSELKAMQEKFKAELEEAKSKLIVEKHNRDKEMNDNALMLRELQKLVAGERAAKEKAESQLVQAQDSVKALQLAGSYNAEFERKVRQLEAELKAKDESIAQLTFQARQMADKSKETPPELTRLKNELADMRLAHCREMDKAEKKANDAEERAAAVRCQQESRVGNLESRLQELSETVGSYERLRQNDQSAMSRLKERIAFLDKENHDLQASTMNDKPPDLLLGSNLDVQTLIEKILHMRSMLRDANRRSENPVDINEFLEDGEGRKWKKMYHDLKDEFDNLVAKSRSPMPVAPVSRNVSPKSVASALDNSDDEVFKLKCHIQTLTEEVKYLKRALSKYEECASNDKQAVEEHRSELTRLEAAHKAELEACEAASKAKILALESEVEKQRERCLSQISEKDDELSGLRAKLASDHGSAEPTNDDAFMEHLAVSNKHRLDTVVLHFNEELSRLKVELRDLRSLKAELEMALHDLQMSSISKEQRLRDEIEDMGVAMARLKRMATKEGSNLEYLKNVVLTYMLSTDIKSKEHMLKAIGAILLFSDREIRQVKDYNVSWWPSSSASTKH